MKHPPARPPVMCLIDWEFAVHNPVPAPQKYTLHNPAYSGIISRAACKRRAYGITAQHIDRD